MQRRLLLLTLIAATAYAEQHSLDWVLPRGGTRGKTVDVTLSGTFLGDPKEIFFYDKGIEAIDIAPGDKAPDRPDRPNRNLDRTVKARFVIAPDCPVGEHVLRLRTATQLTEAVTFWVDRFPTVTELEKNTGENDTRATAQPIFSDTTVEGQINPGAQADVDYYKADFQQGERISVEIDSVRLGTVYQGGESDLAVRILDADGKELGRNDDSALHVQDPILSILAPRTGSYYIEIKQQIYTQPRQAWYRAHIGTFTRPTGIYPAGGQAGTQLNAHILGDPSGERSETIALPQAPGDFAYFSGKPLDQPPSPNTLRVSPYPNVLKIEGEAPTPVPALPAALNGVLTKKNSADTFQFTAKKGQEWQLRVYARTLGSPMDPRIWIAGANAPKHLLDADDAKPVEIGLLTWRGTWHTKELLDPAVVFKTPADGDYILGIEDSRGSAGPDDIYRIEIEPARDAYYTHISMSDGYQMPRINGLIVPQGSRWTLDVQLAPGLGNNYKGDIELEARGLPRGVTMIAPRFVKAAARMPVQFIAAPDAEQQTAAVELLARAVDPKVHLETGSRQVFSEYETGGQHPWYFVKVDKFALAVTKPAPFRIELEQPAIPIGQSGTLELKVKATREKDFKGAIEIQPDWLPPGVSKAGSVTIAADKTEAVLVINANAKAAPGVYRIAMNASTADGGDGYTGIGRVRVSSAFVDLKISEPYLSITLNRSAVERGQKAEITAAIQQQKPFPGSAKVTLLRLPKGVKLVDPAPQITVKDTQITFTVQADPEALVGLYKEIACELTVTDNGQSIHQQTGSGILRVDPARSVTASR
jgi:hypothetical protein